LVVAQGVVVVRRGAADGDDRLAGGGLDGARARALLRAVDALLEQQRDDRDEDRQQADDAEHRQRVAQAERQPPPRGRRQRAQHRGRFAGRLARARRLDGQRLLEVRDQRLDVGVAAPQVLVGHAVEHRGERGRRLRAARLQVRHVLADVLHRHRDLVLAVERHVADEHLVQHHAERVDVGLAVDVVPERLLR